MGDSGWYFEVEGTPRIHDPTAEHIARGLRQLDAASGHGFAIIEASDGSYVQVGGSGGGCLIEWRDASDERQYRGYQDSPVVPFEDGTVLCFSGSEISLNRNEWFTIDQAVEVFTTFGRSRSFPAFIHWRDITLMLYPERAT